MGALIRWIAIVVSLFVVVGFAAFAVDEMNRGSQTQQNALDRDLNTQNKDVTINDPSPVPHARSGCASSSTARCARRSTT